MTKKITISPKQDLTDKLAERGLLPMDATFPAYSDDERAQVLRIWDGYRDRAAEMKISPEQVAGIAAAAGDIIKGEGDDDFVLAMRRHIAVESLTAEETLERAKTLTAYFLARRPDLSA